MPVSPVRIDPLTIFVVMAWNPDLSARRMRAHIPHIDSCKDEHKGKTETENQQLHLMCLSSW